MYPGMVSHVYSLVLLLKAQITLSMLKVIIPWAKSGLISIYFSSVFMCYRIITVQMKIFYWKSLMVTDHRRTAE